jgi:TonB family protein
VIRLNPNFSPGYDALATVMGMRGKNFSEAETYMEKAVSLEPGDIAARINQANLLVRMNRDRDAIEKLEFALKLAHTPEDVAAVENLLQSSKRFEAERAKMQKKLASVPIAPVGGPSNAPGVTMPRAIHTVPVEYTEEARNAKRQGICGLSLVVGADGKPSNIVVINKLGMGLDQKAIDAVRQWTFEPARRNGRPIPSRLMLNVSFSLYGTENDKFIELSEKAKQGGHPQAQFELAERIYGDGTNSANYVEAYVWYARSQRGDYAASEAKISELESRMTEEQLAEARNKLASALPSTK